MDMLPKMITLTALAALSLASGRSEAAGKCPNLHFIIDRSGSMTGSFDTTTRWNAEVAAINKVVAKYDGKMPMGATLFTTGTTCSPDPIIRPALGTKSTISAALAAKAPGGNSGLGSAINPTVALAELRDTTRSNYLIIVTDGPPVCAGGTYDTTIDSSVNDVRTAYLRTPSLKTALFVFDDTLTTTDKASLSTLAEAGGKPATGTYKYYPLTTTAGLATSLEQFADDIYTASGCDGTSPGDTCYEKGCARATDFCIRSVCAPNPCAGYTCSAGDYCFTDGASSPTCVTACPASCPSGTRCKGDSCSPDPCGGPCAAGKICDKTSKTCKTDPTCSGVVCKGTSRCVSGLCVDDPCDFITCPVGRRCISWDGSCEVPGQNPLPDMSSVPPRDMGTGPSVDMASGIEDSADMAGPPPHVGYGCTTTSSNGTSAAALAGLLIASAMLLSLRRLRRT